MRRPTIVLDVAELERHLYRTGEPNEVLGARLRLWVAAYQQGGYLPDDEEQLRLLAHASLEEWERIRETLLGSWRHEPKRHRYLLARVRAQVKGRDRSRTKRSTAAKEGHAGRRRVRAVEQLEEIARRSREEWDSKGRAVGDNNHSAIARRNGVSRKIKTDTALRGDATSNSCIPCASDSAPIGATALIPGVRGNAHGDSGLRGDATFGRDPVISARASETFSEKRRLKTRSLQSGKYYARARELAEALDQVDGEASGRPSATFVGALEELLEEHEGREPEVLARVSADNVARAAELAELLDRIDGKRRAPGEQHPNATFLALVARTVPVALTNEALAATRDARDARKLRTSAGAYFAGAVRRIAEREGLELAIRWRNAG